MSRYIDADALIEEMSEKHRPNFHEDLKSYHMWIMWYWALKEAPSIDIVRCGECKRRKKNGFCLEHNRYEKNDNGYCSYGERKSDEQ